MKNREKFRDEIAEAIKERNYENEKTCCFLRDNVIPRFTSETDRERDMCGNLECYACANMFAFWLDEEYEEPPKPEVDWSKVPVDTLVRVRDYENDEWCLRYFKGIDKSNPEEKYEAWVNGTTSKTSNDKYVHWKYCELVEVEDENSSI